MAGVLPVNSVGQFETRPQGRRPSAVDHPVEVGPPALPTAVGPQVAPPTGVVAVATPLRLTAQVRDGIAMFGTGETRAVTFPIMGAGAPSSVAQTSVTKMLSGAGIASEALDLQHFISA